MADSDNPLVEGECRPTFVRTRSGSVKWSPDVGDLVTDPALDRVGKAVGWDGEIVSIAPLDGGEPWHTTTYRPATASERLRARVAVINRERREHPW